MHPCLYMQQAYHCAQYKAIFDKLQCLTKTLTGWKLQLKQLSKEGILLSIGVDLELAQVLGAGDSFLPTNKPEFSGITTKDPSEIVKYFVHACCAHVKRLDEILYNIYMSSINKLFIVASMIWGCMLMMNSTAVYWILCPWNQRVRLRSSLHGIPIQAYNKLSVC